MQEKLSAISRRAKLVLADGLEGRRSKLSDVGPLREFLMTLALLVRAHETDTNAWYPVAPTQPRASAVRRRRRGINAHQQCREEEQLRAASKVQKNFDGKRTRNESDGTSRKGCKQFKCTWKRQWLMQRKRWASKNQDETRCHCAPFAWITRASLFCVTGAKRGKDSAVTVPAPYRPTGARLQPGPVLTIP
jgi:hypothetical protein